MWRTSGLKLSSDATIPDRRMGAARFPGRSTGAQDKQGKGRQKLPDGSKHGASQPTRGTECGKEQPKWAAKLRVVDLPISLRNHEHVVGPINVRDTWFDFGRVVIVARLKRTTRDRGILDEP